MICLFCFKWQEDEIKSLISIVTKYDSNHYYLGYQEYFDAQIVAPGNTKRSDSAIRLKFTDILKHSTQYTQYFNK